MSLNCVQYYVLEDEKSAPRTKRSILATCLSVIALLLFAGFVFRIMDGKWYISQAANREDRHRTAAEGIYERASGDQYIVGVGRADITGYNFLAQRCLN